MKDGVQKLTISRRPGWYVYAFKPHRTKKGHCIWKRSHIVAGPFATYDDALLLYPSATADDMRMNRLTVDEELKVLGEEQP